MSLTSEGEPDQMTQLEYQGSVGSLLFTSTCCRPDVSFPVHYVAQGNLKRTSSLVQSLDRIIHYVIQTKHWPCPDPKRLYGCFLWCKCQRWRWAFFYGWVFTLVLCPRQLSVMLRHLSRQPKLSSWVQRRLSCKLCIFKHFFMTLAHLKFFRLRFPLIVKLHIKLS